ncbi:MAG: 3-dehydroquinate synthase [Pseudomonadota bacterium]
MKTIQVKTGNHISDIHVGEHLANAGLYIPPGKCVIITDTTVSHFYRDLFPPGDVITIGCGEGIKTLGTLEMIYRELIRLGADRQTFILGIGGGIVCDIAGFAASTFMRGLRFGFVSTTLLSQVDASVGGKNGVNVDSYKNMAGVFAQPEFVICDVSLLASLPPCEISNGFGEIVKHALILDKDLFTYIDGNWESALNLDPEVITSLVTTSVRIKADVVQKDEREAGERRKLNFGHTIGHALEKLTGTGHGSAVSMGMVAAAAFSRSRGLLADADCKRITDLLARLNLPVTWDVPVSHIMETVMKDKKRAAETVHFVFLSSIGTSLVETIRFSELETFLSTW